MKVIRLNFQLASIVKQFQKSPKEDPEEQAANLKEGEKLFNDFEPFFLDKKSYFEDTTCKLLEEIRMNFSIVLSSYRELQRLRAISSPYENLKPLYGNARTASDYITYNVPGILNKLNDDYIQLEKPK